MRLSFDGKSVVVGLFAGAALVAGFGAAQNGQPPVGRFEVEAVTTGTGSYHAYVVDTATGQVWEYGNQRFGLSKLGN